MMKESSNLHWLQGWYLMHCNGDWEHGFGLRIYSLAQPGWQLKINLVGTICERETLNFTEFRRSEQDGYGYEVKDKVFLASGGVTNLEEMIGVFRNWVADTIEKIGEGK